MGSDIEDENIKTVLKGTLNSVHSKLAVGNARKDGGSDGFTRGWEATPQAVEGEEALVSRLRGLALGTDRWTALLVALWALLFLALVVNKQELWVVLAGLVAYACFCFLLDVVAIPPIWDGPLKAKETARLSNSLVCIAHALAMGFAALFGASAILKLTMTCGFLLFDLWDKTWKRLYTSPPYRFTRGIPYALQGATTLVLSITAICKGVPINADLLVGIPAAHLLVESVHDLTRMFASERAPPLGLARVTETVVLFPARLLPHALLLVSHILTIHATSALPCASTPPSTLPVLSTWWATRVMTVLLVMLNASNLASLFWPAFLRQRFLAQHRLQPRQGHEQRPGAALPPSPPPPSSLWFVHGEAYDLSPFLCKHPGGSHALRLGQGRDCTALFESYHPFTERHRQILAKHRVAVEETVLDAYCLGGGARGQGRGKDVFYETLKRRVAAAMAGVDVVASWKRRAYYLLVLLAVLISYRGFLQGHWSALLVFSLSSWLLGAMGHDGSHFACSHRPGVNRLCGLGISLIASPFLWYHQHTFAHHSFTNDFDHDPDLHHFVLTRPHARQPRGPHHALQQFRLYVLAQYAVVVFGETVWIPLKLLCFRTLHGVMAFPNIGWDGLARALAHFVLYYLLVFHAPARCLAEAGEGAYKAWAFPLLYVSICGMLFGVFSQINHLNEKSIAAARGGSGHEGKKGRTGGSSWAKEQVETSSNFATHSPWWFVLSNGLNFQIEHHLFPGINHEHLWRVQPVVKEACKEFGVNYKSYESIMEIVWETAQYYKSLA